MKPIAKKQLADAIDDALNGSGESMHSPAVHWTPDKGLFVCPAADLVPMDDDEVEIWVANFSASDGSPYCAPSIDEVRDMIADRTS